MVRNRTVLLVVVMLLMAAGPPSLIARVGTPAVPGDQRIAFASTHGAPDGMVFDLYTVAVDGSGLTRLTTYGEDGMEAVAPTWSPDGSRIAFGTRDVMRAGYGISLMDADGGNPVQLTDVGDCNDFDFFEIYGPVWSPDGSRFAFAADFDRACGQGVLPDIYLADASGETVTRLTSFSDQGYASWLPDWSPDGDAIVFVSGPNDAMGQCYVVDVPDGAPVRIAEDETACLFPVWSPDGAFIAGAGLDGFVLIPMEGGEPVSIPVDSASGLIWNPSWSPDGSMLLFETFPSDDRAPHLASVYVLDVASGRVTEIEANTPFPVAPAWSPDGRLIAFVGRLDGQVGTDLYIVRPDGSDPARVTTVGDGGAYVAWPAFDPPSWDVERIGWANP
jgi:Tol biopolymer transport system component